MGKKNDTKKEIISAADSKKTGEIEKSHSKAHKKDLKYDYNNNQNVMDAQKEYEMKLDAKRGVPGSERYGLSETNVDSAVTHIPVSGKTEETVYVSSINHYRRGDSKIENRPIDLLELYEKSARGGEASTAFSKEFNASEDDIATLLDTRDIKSSRGVKYKISDTTGSAVGAVSHYVYNVSSSGTDFGQGVRQVGMMVSPIAFVVTDRLLMNASKTLQKDLAFRLNKLAIDNGVFGDGAKYIDVPELGLTNKEIQEIRKELIKKLGPSGLKAVGKRGVVSYNQINKFLSKNEGKLLKSEIGAAKMLKELTRYQIIREKALVGRRRFRGSLRTRLFRYIQQDSAGTGLVFTYTMYRRAYQTFKYGLRSVRTAAKNVALAGKLALQASTKVAAVLAKTKLAQKLAQTKPGEKAIAGKNAVNRKIDQAKNLAEGAKNKVQNSRLAKMKRAFEERHKNLKTFMRDPFKLKSNRLALFNKLKATRIGKAINKVISPYKMLKEILARILAGIMAAISALLSIIMVICTLMIVVVVIVILVISIVMWVVSIFDLSSSDEKVIKEGLEYIKELSEKQNERLEDMNGRYSNINITYKNIKNDDAYNNPDYQPERPVVETTNSAEIMSMAQVYFDFDLESADKDKVKDYIKKLYNGSHVIEVIEHPVYTTDKNGKQKLAYINADVNFVTYYFDALFDVKLSNGDVGILQTGTIAAGTEIEVPNSFEQCVTVTMYDQWVYDWGVSPGTGQRKVSDIWVEQGGKFDNGLAYIDVGGQKRYLIALVDTFGVCGDYVDAYLSDGSVLPCIIADAKSRNDANITDWGHATGNAISVLEMEVQRSYYYQYGNPGGPNWWPELANPVTKIVNGGSMFAYPDGPIQPSEPETEKESE